MVIVLCAAMMTCSCSLVSTIIVGNFMASFRVGFILRNIPVIHYVGNIKRM